MRTLQLIFILTFFFNLYAFSQEWLTDKEELNQKVKSVLYNKVTIVGEDKSNWWNETSIKHYNKQGFLTKSNLIRSMFGIYKYGIFREFNEDGTQCLTEYKIFDNDSSHVENFTYDSLGRVEKKVVNCFGEHCSTHYYYYDEKNKVIERFSLMFYDKDTIRVIYEYDDNGNKIKKSDVSNNYFIIKTWKYDIHGKITQEKSELRKSPGTTIVSWQDDGTRKVEKVDSNPDDDRNYVIHYEYNDKNQVIHEVRKYLDGRIAYDVRYTYNKKGLIATEKFLTSECCEDGSASYKYKFDVHGNWILITRKGKKILDTIEKRKIEYF